MKITCLQRKGAVLFLLIFSCLLLSSCALIRPSQKKIESETWLPADTVALVSVSNAQQAREKWDKTAAGKAWKTPELDYYLSRQFYPAMDALCGKAGIENGRSILNLITGEILLALELPTNGKKSDRKPVGYLIADFGNNSAQAKKMVEDAFTKNPALAKKARIKHEWIDEHLVLVSSDTKLADLKKRRKANKAIFFAKRKKEALPSLDTNITWQKMQDHRLGGSDTFVYADIDRIYKSASQLAQNRLAEKKMMTQWVALNLLIKTLGIDDLEAAAASVQMRDKGFYTYTAIIYQQNPTGIFAPLEDPKPLQTPGLVGKNIESYTATTIHPPARMKEMFFQTLKAENPFLETMLTPIINNFERKAGFDIDTVLAGFGSEIALISDSASSGPAKMVMLWEIRDKGALDQTMKIVMDKWNGATEQHSAGKYSYESHKFPNLQMPIYTAQVGNFLMVSAQDQWIKSFAAREEDTGKIATTDGSNRTPNAVDSLLPILEEPFDKPAKEDVVTGRDFENPAPGLIQLNGMIPLAIPVVNMQLKRMGQPAIPMWTMGTIPPLLPFAQNAFPSVSRVMQRDRQTVIKERYSSFDPALSPLAAMAVVIAGHNLTTEKPR